MEAGNNSLRPTTLSKTSSERKCPTRLQSRAPAALSLDEITPPMNVLESYFLPSGCVIPLLSPLFKSPLPFVEAEAGQGQVAGANVDLQKGRVEQAPSPDQTVAAIGPAEPSNFFAFCRAQCSLVQPTQIL